MAIGDRIRFFRNLRGMTQKFLGVAVGFPERTADVRIAQYESGTRTPKHDLKKLLAYVLDISPQALDVPDIDSYFGIMHTLFALEDLRGLQVKEIDGETYLRVDNSRDGDEELIKMLKAWRLEALKLESGEITKEEYDKWRYHFPKFDTTQKWAWIPSKELSDLFAKKFKRS